MRGGACREELLGARTEEGGRREIIQGPTGREGALRRAGEKAEASNPAKRWREGS